MKQDLFDAGVQRDGAMALDKPVVFQFRLCFDIVNSEIRFNYLCVP